MTLHRRDLLRSGALMALVPGVFGTRLAFAAAPTRNILVVVHQRGGCDGLNLISPADDPAFIAARVAELRVATDGPDAGFHLDNGPDPRVDFRLHASAGALAELYGSKQLAFIHAVGLSDANRSHFVAQDMMERGVGNTAALAKVSSGWLARHLRLEGVSGTVTAACAGNALSGEFADWSGSLAVPNLDGGLTAPGGAEATAVLNRLYDNAPGPIGVVARDTLAAITAVDARVARDASHKIIPYKPDGGGAYEKAGGFGNGLKTIAQLIKMDIGLTAASVDLGGWDTHENQPGRFKTAVDQLSNGLGTFWNDLTAYHDRLTVVTVTEFGRRLRSNRSNGTDHGRAGVMTVLGGQIAGGRIYGPWPGLSETQLEEGVDLAVKTDYRAVLSEVLKAQDGGAGPVFANYVVPAPLGLFSGARVTSD